MDVLMPVKYDSMVKGVASWECLPHSHFEMNGSYRHFHRGLCLNAKTDTLIEKQIGIALPLPYVLFSPFGAAAIAVFM